MNLKSSFSRDIGVRRKRGKNLRRTGSRADYFMKMIKEAGYFGQKFSEIELISIIGAHFNYEVRRGIINGGTKRLMRWKSI